MNAETLDLARLQFALTAATHFLFVALTLGLVTLVACVQTRATFTRDPVHERMTRFWGQLYVINYAVGIVTGLVMELQLGLVWGGLGHFAGNVFGASLAMETLTAFFVESTFLGLWIFGWGRLNRWAHLAVIWVVTLTSYVSAYWIMVSNGFLQHPAGATVVDGVLRLTDATAVLTNPGAVLAFGHILSGALVTAGVVMAGVSAYHLRARTTEQELFRKSLRVGVATALPALLVTVALGGAQFGVLSDAQPMKLAVFGGDAGEIARLQAEAAARYGQGDYVPSQVWGQAGYVMIACWAALALVTVVSVVRMRSRDRVRHSRLWHALLTAAIPLPFVAMIAGWVWRESGRQPWVVYGLLSTRDALSDLSPAALRASLAVFATLFAVLATVNYWLLARYARRGPGATALGSPETPCVPLPAATF
ncbi:cytochrome ubiquinol oxidase subunit I [Sphaerisporangium corydalis]|uniref:Cytochrome ubiquinol oxidase subunit I n=1 Tax=Sphaerisporangium corydalis TaxID=1441875 RepID=A0ABV9E699_9ACTN|nr:cytochrome ubiquinol oxidase subunit I [Sphaerisporangium corydalis]